MKNHGHVFKDMGMPNMKDVSMCFEGMGMGCKGMAICSKLWPHAVKVWKSVVMARNIFQGVGMGWEDL